MQYMQLEQCLRELLNICKIWYKQLQIEYNNSPFWMGMSSPIMFSINSLKHEFINRKTHFNVKSSNTSYDITQRHSMYTQKRTHTGALYYLMISAIKFTILIQPYTCSMILWVCKHWFATNTVILWTYYIILLRGIVLLTVVSKLTENKNTLCGATSSSVVTFNVTHNFYAIYIPQWMTYSS